MNIDSIRIQAKMPPFLEERLTLENIPPVFGQLFRKNLEPCSGFRRKHCIMSNKREARGHCKMNTAFQ